MLRVHSYRNQDRFHVQLSHVVAGVMFPFKMAGVMFPSKMGGAMLPPMVAVTMFLLVVAGEFYLHAQLHGGLLLYL